MFTGTLPVNAQKSLAVLGKSQCLPPQTYLAGGSALALYFGHRLSVDFDFFTPESFDQEKMAKELARYGKFDTTQIAPDTLPGNFEKTKFSLFRYQCPLISSTADCMGIKIAGLEDIAAMKIAAVMDRGTKKDFIDLYFLSGNGITLDDCLDFYNRKYKLLENNLYSIVISLSYFAGAEVTKMPKMFKPVSWTEVKNFFEKEAVRLAKKQLI